MKYRDAWLYRQLFMRCRHSMIFVAIAFLLATCRLVPVQMVRVTQTEFYTQTFESLKIETVQANLQDRPVDLDQNKHIDETFTRLLGEKNWQSFKDRFGLRSVRDELLKGDIKAKGLLSLVIYINPTDHEEFLIEGSGTYFITRENDEVLLSGEFRLPLQSHAITKLKEGMVPISVYLYTSNIPGNTTFFHEAKMLYCVYMETLWNEDTYAIKRKQSDSQDDVVHPVYFLERFDKTNPNASQIGSLRFERDDSHSKVIDLRGLKMVRKYQ